MVAPVGTTATIDPELQLEIVAEVPLNFTVPCVEPKFAPVIVTDAPIAPDVGERPVTVGVARTVNGLPLVETPDGTIATIDVLLQLVIEEAGVKLNCTVPVPCDDPKFVPVSVTDVPTAPDVGNKLASVGVASTVNDEPLLATLLTVTTTLPVVAPDGTTATIDVALQLVIEVTAVVLNFTVLVP